MKRHTVVFYGGKSAEHDISIITAQQIFNFSRGQKRVYIDEKNRWWLVRGKVSAASHKRKRRYPAFLPVVMVAGSRRLFLRLFGGRMLLPLFEIDCAVCCFHGLFGEDGCVQGVFEMCGVAYTGSGVGASAAGMDKGLFKTLLKGLGVPHVPGFVLTRAEYCAADIPTEAESTASNAESAANTVEDAAVNAENAESVRLSPRVRDIAAKLQFPLIVKPVRLGSSIGIGVAHNEPELAAALEVAFCFDNAVLIEREVQDFHEINCSALSLSGGRVLTSRLERPVSAGEILSFADKYLGVGKNGKNTAKNEGKSTENFIYDPKTQAPPAPVDCKFESRIRRDAEKICRALGVSGVCRIDFLVTDKAYYINEINTIPGSLSYHLWRDRFTKAEFLGALLDAAKRRKAAADALVYAYKSDVLKRPK